MLKFLKSGCGCKNSWWLVTDFTLHDFWVTDKIDFWFLRMTVHPEGSDGKLGDSLFSVLLFYLQKKCLIFPFFDSTHARGYKVSSLKHKRIIVKIPLITFLFLYTTKQLHIKKKKTLTCWEVFRALPVSAIDSEIMINCSFYKAGFKVS